MSHIQAAEKIFNLSESYIKGIIREITLEVESRVREKTAEITDPKPEWIRFKTAEKIFDLSESYLKGLIENNRIKSKLLKERGQIRGIRLISYDSLNAYIEEGGE